MKICPDLKLFYIFILCKILFLRLSWLLLRWIQMARGHIHFYYRQRCCPGPQLIPTWQPWFFQTRCLPSYRVWQKAYAVCPNNKCYIKWLYLPTKCCCRRYRWWWWARSEKALCDDTHTQVTAKWCRYSQWLGQPSLQRISHQNCSHFLFFVLASSSENKHIENWKYHDIATLLY